MNNEYNDNVILKFKNLGILTNIDKNNTIVIDCFYNENFKTFY